MLFILFLVLANTAADSFNIGREYLMVSKYKEAIPYLKEGFQLGFAYENLGDYTTAIKYYKESHPILIEHKLYGIARCFKNLSRYDEAIDYYEALLDTAPDFVFIHWAVQELAWCYEKIGDYENALDVWTYEVEPPLGWYKVALLYDKIGKKSDTLWLSIATQYPDYTLEAIPHLPKDSVLLIGKLYYLAKNYNSCISLLTGVKGGEELLAQSLYQLDKYAEALEIAIPNRLWLIAGKCNEKLGNIESAIAYYTKSGTPDALYSKANLSKDLGRDEEALFAYFSIPDTFANFEFASLRAGLLGIKLGKLDIAFKAFRRITPPISYYWCYRIMKLERNEWKANLYRQKLIDEYPISYYAWLAGGGSGILDIEPEKWIAAQDTSTITTAEQSRFERGKLLIELGIIKYGTAEFNKLPKKLLLCWKIANFFHSYELTWLALPYARQMEVKGGLPRKVAQSIYPLKFWNELQQSAQSYKVDKFLFLALVREESYFNPSAVSSSNAIGLGQVIPPTGKLIAKKLGIQKYNLFDPSTSIKFGAFYLAQCIADFNGNWQCALAGYNGGPHNVKKWIAERSTAKMDEWVEWIPFKETRQYVKKVTKTYYAYKMLYSEGSTSK
ncbi:MAG: transglycosylase SLT domain-containing protein [Candidatus Stahlbacteria bacterium]|nr:transglycosylase SLT domain-containing protein [Candidatus Stahlbacteria bacterium]